MSDSAFIGATMPSAGRRPASTAPAPVASACIAPRRLGSAASIAKAGAAWRSPASTSPSLFRRQEQQGAALAERAALRLAHRVEHVRPLPQRGGEARGRDLGQFRRRRLDHRDDLVLRKGLLIGEMVPLPRQVAAEQALGVGIDRELRQGIEGRGDRQHRRHGDDPPAPAHAKPDDCRRPRNDPSAQPVVRESAQALVSPNSLSGRNRSIRTPPWLPALARGAWRAPACLTGHARVSLGMPGRWPSRYRARRISRLTAG